MAEKATWSNNHIPLSELLGIITNKKIETANNFQNNQYMIKEWRLPERQVLLTVDGLWWIALDYPQSANPSVS